MKFSHLRESLIGIQRNGIQRDNKNSYNRGKRLLRIPMNKKVSGITFIIDLNITNTTKHVLHIVPGAAIYHCLSQKLVHFSGTFFAFFVRWMRQKCKMRSRFLPYQKNKKAEKSK